MGYIAPISNIQSKQYQIYDELAVRRAQVEAAGQIAKTAPVKYRNLEAAVETADHSAKLLPISPSKMKPSRIIARITGLGQKIDIRI